MSIVRNNASRSLSFLFKNILNTINYVKKFKLKENNMNIFGLGVAALAIAAKTTQGKEIDVNKICKKDKACIENANNNLKMMECTKKIMTSSGGSFEMPTEDDLKLMDPPEIQKNVLDRCEKITSEIDNNPKLFEKYAFPYFYGGCLTSDLMEDHSGEKTPFDMSEPDSYQPNCEKYLKELKNDHPNFFNPSEQEL